MTELVADERGQCCVVQDAGGRSDQANAERPLSEQRLCVDMLSTMRRLEDDERLSNPESSGGVTRDAVHSLCHRLFEANAQLAQPRARLFHQPAAPWSF